MNKTSCPQEAAVAQALRSNHWEPALTAHVEECSDCAEVARASRWMLELNTASKRERGFDPQEANRLWWLAQMRERSAKADRAMIPIEIAYGMAIVAATIGFAIGVDANWSLLERAQAWVLDAFKLQRWLAGDSLEALGSAAAWSIAGIAFLAAILAALPVLTRE